MSAPTKNLPTELLFATTNKGKLKEMRELCLPYGVRIIAPNEISRPTPPPEVEETGDTYFANAKLKADALFAWSGLPTLADDTGIEVRALGGAPGVLTARYSGPGATSVKNIELLLKNMTGVSDRTARFVCVLYLLTDSIVRDSLGTLDGSVAHEKTGTGGFGYDSVFIVGDTGLSLSTLKAQGPGLLTHRAKALAAILA